MLRDARDSFSSLPALSRFFIAPHYSPLTICHPRSHRVQTARAV